jgi:hypothetical protein
LITHRIEIDRPADVFAQADRLHGRKGRCLHRALLMAFALGLVVLLGLSSLAWARLQLVSKTSDGDPADGHN